MERMIETPTIGEILLEEFMKPLGISAYRLSKDIGVPTSRIQDIVHNRRRMTADTSLRLGKYFGVSEKYFISMQDDIDIRNLKISIKEELSQIKEYSYNKTKEENTMSKESAMKFMADISKGGAAR